MIGDSDLHRHVNAWITKRSQGLTYPVYTSLDLRIAPYKAAVVDANLFPCGFNNLCDTMVASSSSALQAYMKEHYPTVKTIAVFCEAHTRNDFYFLNLQALNRIVRGAGFTCLFAHPAFEGERDGLLFSLNHLNQADLVISNNDFSDGYPALLNELTIPVIPHKSLIWANRRKSRHFSILKELASELGHEIGQDPWLFSTEFSVEHRANLRDDQSLERIKSKATTLFTSIQKKYTEHGITAEPTLFLKDDAGTYGMGIMTITNIEELNSLNRKTINKMQVGKQHDIKALIIQEGVPSQVRHLDSVAEPVLYCVGNTFVGSFLRVNHLRDELANLNAKGMEFFRLCEQDKDKSHLPSECCGLDIMTDSSRIAAKLSLLAAAMENSQTIPR
jgi:glutamate--cysteine ligase